MTFVYLTHAVDGEPPLEVRFHDGTPRVTLDRFGGFELCELDAEQVARLHRHLGDWLDGWSTDSLELVS